jgi:heme exporter protein D
LHEFLGMGGYGAYVWSAFGIGLGVMLALLVQSWRAARRREVELAELRSQVRPTRVRPAPLRPRRETAPAPSGAGESA